MTSSPPHRAITRHFAVLFFTIFIIAIYDYPDNSAIKVLNIGL